MQEQQPRVQARLLCGRVYSTKWSVISPVSTCCCKWHPLQPKHTHVRYSRPGSARYDKQRWVARPQPLSPLFAASSSLNSMLPIMLPCLQSLIPAIPFPSGVHEYRTCQNPFPYGEHEHSTTIRTFFAASSARSFLILSSSASNSCSSS